jgi:hypothetical protein
MQIVFFKRPKPRQFDYKPRYYDEEKERREERRKAFEEAEKGGTSSTTLRRNIDVRWRKADRRNRQRAKSVNLLVYVVIVALLVYFMFFV